MLFPPLLWRGYSIINSAINTGDLFAFEANFGHATRKLGMEALQQATPCPARKRLARHDPGKEGELSAQAPL